MQGMVFEYISVDDGADKGVSDLRVKERTIKKGKYIWVMFCAMFLGMFIFMTMPAQAADISDDEPAIDVEGLLSEAEQKVSQAFSEIDKEKAGEIFDFVKEKVKGGSLETEEGLKDVIEEGEKKFGVTIDAEVARQIVDVVEKLEAAGFSGEEIIDRARSLYDTYGADFMTHANEVFTQVVEEAVENAFKRFFINLWEGIKTSVENLFKSL